MTMQWLHWAQNLQALAQNGLTFAHDPFDIQRYEAVRQIAADMLGALAHTEPQRILDLWRQEVGYATPKVDVRAAVFRQGRILLVRERCDGLWTLPGGWVDVNESPSEAVTRETYEESGYHTRAVRLLAVHDKNKHAHPPSAHHSFKLFFHCELLGGEPVQTVETDAVDFFHANALPALSLSRVTPAQIARLFDYMQHPEWPTEFD